MISTRVFRRFSQMKFPTTYPEDVAALRKMIHYRCTRAGIKEVEYLLGEWSLKNLDSMNRDQLIQFQTEVLNIETPELLRILLGQSTDNGEHYVVALRNFVDQKLSITQ